jgi:hypothetical protein
MSNSLCEACAHVRVINTPKGSRFLLCELSTRDPGYPKYPPQPVRQCNGHLLRTLTGMTPVFHEPHFTFRFVDDRIIKRFHLEGVAGVRVNVYQVDAATGVQQQIASGIADDEGWVTFFSPLEVRKGDELIAVVEAVPTY